MSRLKTEYEKNGFYSPVSVIDASLAKDYRVILENVESKIELLYSRLFNLQIYLVWCQYKVRDSYLEVRVGVQFLLNVVPDFPT